jgi:hypothetical protein
MATKDKQLSKEQQIKELQAQINKLRGKDTEGSDYIGVHFNRGVHFKFGGKLPMVETKLSRWFRDDEFFAGFRNTPARALITALSIAALFGYGYYAFMNPELSFWYLSFICLVWLMQAISVRFVFNMEGKSAGKLLDEYHLKRRDKALQRSMESLAGVLGLLLIAAFLYGYKDYVFGDKELTFNPLPDAVFNFSLTGGQFLEIAFFASGWIAFQKYWAYGIKGEPMLSREEARKLRNS